MIITFISIGRLVVWPYGHEKHVPPPSCRDLIVKINDRPEQRMLPNKVVSDLFADTPDARIVRVLAYDWHQRTPHEVLVMRRANGANLLAHAIDMPEAQLRSIFRQTCRLAVRLHRFYGFGEIIEVGAGGSNPSFAFATCPEFLLTDFEENVAKIKSGRLVDPDDMERSERYRGRQFYALLPDLKAELSDLLADRALLRKLNLLNIGEQLSCVGDAWIAQFGEELVANVLSKELAEDDDSLQNTYFNHT